MSGSGRGRDFERNIDTAERDARAARLRVKRWSFQKIANELGYVHAMSAKRAVERAIAAACQEAGEEARAVALEELDRKAEICWEIIERIHYAHGNGRVVKLEGVPLVDDMPTLAAIDRLLRIMERRAKLLGLDAPLTIRDMTESAVDASIAELTARLNRRAAAAEAAATPGATEAS